ncbi:MAG TPA: hypothetical protein VMS98_12330 [Thermoanaerobaculia bacterium]|nr:hypothetical protein [Thermoanaerobaculia bacterium]
MVNERRVYQRLHLTRSLEGWFGDLAVRVVDVSATGAQIEHHYNDVPGSGQLRFTWRDQEITIECETIHFSDDRAGLHFVEDNELLRRLIAESAAEVLAAQKANLGGDRAHNLIGEEIGEATLTAASAGLKAKAWVTLTLEDGGWKRRKSLLPDQPENGFTVSGAEPDEQIEILCKTYQGGNDEARRLTRLLAELSAASVRG